MDQTQEESAPVEDSQGEAHEDLPPVGSQSSGLPGAPPVGQNLQIIDDDDDGNTVNFEEQAAEMEETTATSPTATTTHLSRYPRREHRAPSRYSDYVLISYVEDETSS